VVVTPDDEFLGFRGRCRIGAPDDEFVGFCGGGGGVGRLLPPAGEDEGDEGEVGVDFVLFCHFTGFLRLGVHDSYYEIPIAIYLF